MNPDEQPIRELIANLYRAICRKDVDGILRHYSPDAVIFNVKPPYQMANDDRWRRVWETSLAHFPAAFGAETRDMVVTLSGSLAVAHYLMRFTRLGSQNWLRETVVFRKEQGSWKIIHEHSSIPFDPETSKVVFESD
ncbi:MAG TPA: nuclear transport factor 2 family protein [Candidatus Sulfotelmatobacter sp.]|nr:nuclear transport factor 2 family protein [Candidatus Sulfotelmatobacter sp.]